MGSYDLIRVPKDGGRSDESHPRLLLSLWRSSGIAIIRTAI